MNVLTTEPYALIPNDLRSAPRWLVWKAEAQEGGKKARKVPYYVDGRRRSGKLDTPEDWARLATFAAALSALASGVYTGLGFALGADGSHNVWQGIDLDAVPDHPELLATAKALPGYVEFSPSAKGLHAIGYGRAFTSLGSNSSGVEAYAGGRFFTVTGRRRGDGVPCDIADFVERELRPLHGSGTGEIGSASALPGESVINTPDILADVRSAALYIADHANDVHDYHPWIAIGMALKSLGEPGRVIWHEFSARSEVYNPSEADEKFDGFEPDRTGYPAILAKAQRLGWKNPKARPARDEGGACHTEEALALAFARENAAGLRYCAAWGQWYVWDGVRWEVDATLFALDTVRDLCRRTAVNVGNDRAAAALAQARTVTAVERLARSDRQLAATTDQWDAHPWLLNTPGGVVDLRTGEIGPCEPALHMTKVTGAAPGGSCPTWLRFLDRITGGDVDLQAYIQRVLGYTLTGDTSAHALFFGHGTGANGKSVLIDTVAGVLGDYHKTAPIETFTESGGERHPTELAMLRGARLVTAVETEEGRRWAEARIKTLTGGDPITARFMRQDFFTFPPQFKLLVAGNHKPALRSVDEAMRRRLHMIPFDVTIPTGERDPKLKEKLRAEWPGILAWMIEGCLDWQGQGLAPPAAVRAATEAYLEAEDALSAWIEERCERDPQAWEASQTLFSSWKWWAEAHGEHVGSIRRLAQALEARGFMPKRQAQARGMSGLRLKVETEFV